jgi:hypothetical protein
MTESLAVSRNEMLSRIRGEYLDMPGLSLTRAQAQRLWGLDAQTCASLLESLTGDKFLCLRHDGTYGRLSLGAVFSPGPRNSSHMVAENSRSCEAILV